jgi:phosphatidylglycerophosphatase A
VFFLFRLFDIFKPYPINIIDKKIKNGFGVMLDDVLAGIYSVIVFFLIFIGLNYV